MKSCILLIVTTLGIVFSASAQSILEKWTYDGIFTGLLSDAPSETGTQSTFGGSNPFLRVSSDAGLLIAIPTPNREYSGGVSALSYTGKNSGLCQISYEIINIRFADGNSISAKLGWGLRDLNNISHDCNALFQYTNSTFRLIVHDKNGMSETSLPVDKTDFQNIRIRQLYNLDTSGNGGSLRVYYSIGSSSEVEIFPGQLSLYDNFQIGELRMDAFANQLADYNLIAFDNLIFEIPSSDPVLAFKGVNISYIEDNGVLPGETYEPSDILKFDLSNINDSIVSVSNVTSSLYANPMAFDIMPKSTNISMLAPGEIYTTTYQVKILDGATNGLSTFTVTNRINSSSAASLVFPAEFGGE